MTVRVQCCAVWLFALLAAATPARAAAPALQVTLQGKHHLARDAHAAIEVIVQLPDTSAELPLLLTPKIEGAAVELVRGRLLRSDAKRTEQGHLRFELPVVARTRGTAILRVTVITYVCSERCQQVQAATSAVLEAH